MNCSHLGRVQSLSLAKPNYLIARLKELKEISSRNIFNK